MKNSSTNKRAAAIKFEFPFGTELWEFAYITILYLRRVQLASALEKNDFKQLQILEKFKIISLCKETRSAHAKKADIKLDAAQTIYCVRTIDNLAQTLLNDEDLIFTKALVKVASKEMERCRPAAEMRKFYLETAQTVIAEYKELCNTIEAGDRILKELRMEG